MHAATSDIDVDGGLLPRALLQADVATHVTRLSPGDVYRGHPAGPLLSPQLHIRPVLPHPLDLLLTPAKQFERLVEIDDEVVVVSGGNNGLGVAYDETQRMCM